MVNKVFEEYCDICVSLLDPVTHLCTNPDCPNSIPNPTNVVAEVIE